MTNRREADTTGPRHLAQDSYTADCAREAEILGYLAKGRTEPYVREQLWLSRSTVSTRVKHICQKLEKQETISLPCVPAS
ncbi:MAG: LuxR C-terminal-related transcriptional regulator [Coriobacteriales bacterium]|nr:LuxR C-terminal-related transcriptional regulator [Coriobacteriales bacterium]